MGLLNEDLLKQGAESKLFLCNFVGRPALIKERYIRNYRYYGLDTAISKERMKNEARAIMRCKSLDIRTPALYLIDFERRRIYMEYFAKSITVRDYIINLVKKDTEDARVNMIMVMIGECIRKLHEDNIIHGDLTTSNMLLVPKVETEDDSWLVSSDLDLVMIDFGLSYNDNSVEDKGVDLYVLERALISTHNEHPDLFPRILEAYKNYSKNNVTDIISKFEEVRARGRKRTMVG